jgi:hypothetical protein
LNYANATELENYEELQKKLIDIFGEDLIQNLITSNIPNNINHNILEINL